MSSATNSSVLSLKRSREKTQSSKEAIQTDFENFQKEITTEIQKYYEEYNAIQKSQQESIEKTYAELNKFHQELSKRIDQLEQQFSTINADSSENSVQELRDELIEGIAKDVNEKGYLVLEESNGEERHILAGHVILPYWEE